MTIKIGKLIKKQKVKVIMDSGGGQPHFVDLLNVEELWSNTLTLG